MTTPIAATTCSIRDELANINLGDKRLDNRAKLVVETLFSNPTASLPKACKGLGETMGAYRLFDHEDVTWEKILTPHWECTEQRAKARPVVLAVQDTTELDFNGQQIRGLGPLSYPAQRGMYLHATLMISPEREALGVVDAWMYTRELSPDQLAKLPPAPVTKKSVKRAAKLAKNATSATSETSETSACYVPTETACVTAQSMVKESTRWIEGYDRVADMAERLAPTTRVVYIADREGDILALMKRAQERGNPADWLVRAQHDRKLHEGEKLWGSVAATEALGVITFNLVAKKGEKARTITQEIRVKAVMLGRGGKIAATCLIATEVGAPPDTEPVCWRLLTNRSATTLDQAIELIDWYRARWEIEIFFHALKNGCTVEKMQLDTIEKIQNALAMYMVVAWRIMYLMRMGRTCPDLPADLVFEPDEIRVAYLLREKEPPKDRRPTINEVLRLVAQIGGFLARKGDGEPGVQTIWRGIQELRVAVTTVRVLRKLGHLKPGELDQNEGGGSCV